MLSNLKGNNMRNTFKWQALSAIMLLGAGFLLAGCKSAPPLTTQQAQSLIQAKYDQSPATPVTIVVSDLGMRQGIQAGYWKRTTIYPNHYWADFKLTPEGAKLVKLQGGGDVIQWRPMNANDSHYSVTMTSTTATRPKALNVHNIAKESLPGVSHAMGADYSEAVTFTGIPTPLAQIAQNPGNQLTTQRHADFALVNGAWKLHSIE